MKHLLIVHEVEDYATWKRIFDNACDIRKAAGEISYQVFKYDSEPNKIIHLSIWDDMGNAKQFFNSPALVQIRMDAGVKSPDFIYLDLLETGIL
jgi:quinol monooxygenase YgiN